eukprot:SAG31_NODE_8949_length_1358_cov_1.184273_2_plen_188_part_01
MFRMHVKINGIFNVFVYTLIQYNRRYRKLGARHYEKHRIQPRKPWYLTLYCSRGCFCCCSQHIESDKIAQLKKEYEVNRLTDHLINAKIPYNFLSNMMLWLNAFELVVVACSLVTATAYLIINAHVNDFDSSHVKLQADPSMQSWQKALEYISEANAILRMLRLLRVVLRTRRLRKLALSVLKSVRDV